MGLSICYCNGNLDTVRNILRSRDVNASHPGHPSELRLHSVHLTKGYKSVLI